MLRIYIYIYTHVHIDICIYISTRMTVKKLRAPPLCKASTTGEHVVASVFEGMQKWRPWDDLGHEMYGYV